MRVSRHEHGLYVHSYIVNMNLNNQYKPNNNLHSRFMKKTITALSILLVGIVSYGFCQNKTITGTITSAEDKEPLPGVSIKITGAKSGGAQSNINGEYSIEVPQEVKSLTFSMLSYVSQEIAIGDKTKIDVVMAPDKKVLEEVVVMGYAVQSKKDVTSAVSSIKGEAIKDVPVQSFEQALAGKATGVNITLPNGVLNNAPVIRVRGFNSITNSSYPLIILDGVPIFSGDRSPNSAANNPLGDINPADIESIDILKDASATAVYGSRAANGVMVITTKNGKGTGKTGLRYNSWIGVSKVYNMPEVLNGRQYMEIKNEARRNAGYPDAYFPSQNADGSEVDTRWADVVYQTGISTNNHISMSGATEATSYYFAVGYSDQNGFIKKNEFQRKSVRFNLDQKILKRIKVGSNINYASSYNAAPNTGSLPGEGFASGGLGRLAFLTAPNVAPLNHDGSYHVSGPTSMGVGNNIAVSPAPAALTGIYNPLLLLDKDRFTSSSDHIMASIFSEIQIFKSLIFKTTYLADNNSIESMSFQNSEHGDQAINHGLAVNSNIKLTKTGWTNTLNFQKSFAEKHNVFFLTGTEQLYSVSDGWGGSRQNIADDFFQTYQGNFLTNNPPPAAITFQGENGFLSYFAWATYDYKKKYFITASARRDGYSGLSEGNKFGNFGGASVGWALSEEDFYKNLSLSQTIHNIKLRASFGKVGNMGIPDFGSFSLYNSSLYGDVNTITYAQAGNATLRWETSSKSDVGIVIGILQDRIQFEASYFNNNINGLVLNSPQAPSKGIPNNAILINIGSMYNKGLELSVESANISKPNFSWSSNTNFTTIKNEVITLAEGNGDIVGNTSTLERTNITRIGYSLGSIYAVRTDGVNPDNGQRIFINKDGKRVQYNHAPPAGKSRWTYVEDNTTAPAITAADAVIVGNALPKWYGGFNNTIKYKDKIDFNASITFAGGNYIYNGSQAGMRDQRHWNNEVEVMDRWTGAGQQTNIPRVVWGDNVSNGSTFPISENVEKGDFVKLKSMALGYTFRENVFGKTGITSLRLYAQVTNIYTLTKYSGSDPEVSTNGNSNLTPGVDRNTVPQATTYTFGLNLTL